MSEWVSGGGGRGGGREGVGARVAGKGMSGCVCE